MKPIITDAERTRILARLTETRARVYRARDPESSPAPGEATDDPQCPSCGEPVPVPQWGAHRARCAPHYCTGHGGWGPAGPEHCGGCWTHEENHDAAYHSSSESRRIREDRGAQ